MNEEHLKVFLRKNGRFVNYFDAIKDFYNHIFIENPFGCILEVSDYVNCMDGMQYLRNYIVHESEASKIKYIKNCLNKGSFVEPYIYLKQINRHTSVSRYTSYTNKILEIAELICQPSS